MFEGHHQTDIVRLGRLQRKNQCDVFRWYFTRNFGFPLIIAQQIDGGSYLNRTMKITDIILTRTEVLEDSTWLSLPLAVISEWTIIIHKMRTKSFDDICCFCAKILWLVLETNTFFSLAFRFTRIFRFCDVLEFSTFAKWLLNRLATRWFTCQTSWNFLKKMFSRKSSRKVRAWELNFKSQF